MARTMQSSLIVRLGDPMGRFWLASAELKRPQALRNKGFVMICGSCAARKAEIAS